MKFCSDCGADVSLKIPEMEDRLRYVCDACGIIHYQNPKIITGVIVEVGTQILLCKRAIEPRYGYWTFPAGFMENGETTEQAAAREAQEEATVELTNLRLFSVSSIPHVNQVHVVYRGDLVGDRFAPGIESLEVELFDEQDLPWDELAFRSVTQALKCFLEDRKQGIEQVHNLVIS
jgi:ADP-ribose pyrophosphatase YjhB (NUDIX family)